jgi:2-aminoadipate transaminase
MSTFWTSHYAGRAQSLRASEIRELLHLTEQPDVISFAGGLPAPELFPVSELRAACERLLADRGAQALQYGTTEGYLPLREMIARHMSRYGILAGPRNILITSGSQQGLDLVGKLLLDPDDLVAVENPTYLGALQAWRACGARFVPVPMDDDGVRADVLEDTLKRHAPKLIYLMPNFQNPTGVTLSELRRQRIVELAAHYRVPVIEDDPYGQLRYEGDHLTPLRVLDAEWSSGGRPGIEKRETHVLYLSTLSKLLAPGLRIGWIVGPERVVTSLVLAKQGADLHTGTLAQLLAHEVCRGGFLDRHVLALRRAYGERRDAMLRALEEHMPTGVRWTRPEGGLFLWLVLPRELDARQILRQALEQKVAFVPGTGFHPAGGGENTLRLNFSHSPPERIAVGVQRLGRVIESALAASGPRVV